ncbi:MAG: hypothetical protein OXF01_08475 [Gemmatimonadetes bacterium]|nr:hypothetical protein [Gemmatimonadota bacterium]
MSTIPMRPLGFSEIVDGAVQLYRRDFGLYYLIVLVCSLPSYVLTVLWNPAELLESAEAFDSAADPTVALEQMGGLLGQMGFLFLISLVSLAFSFFASLSLTVAMHARIEERPSSLGAAYKGALPHLVSAAGASIVAFLIFLVVFVVVWVAMMFSFVGVSVATGNPWLAVLAFGIMVVALLMVTSLWMGATFGVFPAVVIEGRSAMDALGRSFSLCRGGWLKVIGIMVVATIVSWAPTVAVATFTGTWDLFLSPGEVGTISPTRQWVLNTAGLIVGPLTTPFLLGCIMMLFHDRRVRSEGYDLETLADALGADAT